jgi:pectate lyase
MVVVSVVALCALPAHHGSAFIAAADAQSGIEGFGKVTLGGAAGDTYRVTSLADSGPGTLRHGIVKRRGPRTIVFDVAGDITLESRIKIRAPYLTIAGETAPAPGITIRQRTLLDTLVVGGTHDIVIRHLRFAGGWMPGEPDVEDGKPITIDGDSKPDRVAERIVLDHLTVRGAADGGPDIWGEVRDVTVSWCFFFHNYQTMTVSHNRRFHVRQRISLHHNVFARNGERNPQVRADVRDFDYVNNVVYHWAHGFPDGYGVRIRSGRGEPKVNGNFVNNAFIPGTALPAWGLVYGLRPGADEDDGGPSGSPPLQGAIVTTTKLGKLWVSGNILPPQNKDHYSTVAVPNTIPVDKRVTTWHASELKARVLPDVGTKHRNEEEQHLLDEIAAALAVSPRP